MSFTQQALTELRRGDFSNIITLAQDFIEHYASLYKSAANKVIAQDEIEQLMAYELVKTDIDETDLTKLHLLERLITREEICSHLSLESQANLTKTVAAFCTAISIKTIENYQESIPSEVNGENIIEFLDSDSDFSQLIVHQDCQQEIERLQAFIWNNSDKDSIQTLVTEIEEKSNHSLFFQGLVREKKEKTLHKIEQLKPLCRQYIEHLETVIENHIKKQAPNLHGKIFEDETIEKALDARNGGVDFNQFNELMDNNDHFKLAVEKYRVVSTMLCLLEDKEMNSQSQLKSFKTAFQANTKLLNTRRDSAGMTFIKGVATVLSLGCILLFKNFWKPESQKKAQEMESILTAKL